MSAIDLSRAERAALCDLLDECGPDEPTLCDGWTTRDLTAHLVVREGRVDTALGGLGGPLASWTEKVQNDAASQTFEKLVRLVRNGPPIWSHFRVPFMDGQLNTVEYYVHHEDVRRRGSDWSVRPLSAELSNFLWDRLKLSGRLLFNGVKGAVTLIRTDGPTNSETGEAMIEEHRVKSGKPMITITGTAGELVLIAYGRQEAVTQIDGEPEAVAEFRATPRPIDDMDTSQDPVSMS